MFNVREQNRCGRTGTTLKNQARRRNGNSSAALVKQKIAFGALELALDIRKFRRKSATKANRNCFQEHQTSDGYPLRRYYKTSAPLTISSFLTAPPLLLYGQSFGYGRDLSAFRKGRPPCLAFVTGFRLCACSDT